MTEQEKKKIAEFRPYTENAFRQSELENVIREIYYALKSGIIGDKEKAIYLCTDASKNFNFSLKRAKDS